LTFWSSTMTRRYAMLTYGRVTRGRVRRLRGIVGARVDGLIEKRWQAGLTLLDPASPPGAPDEVIEPDGPWPFRERWRRACHRGTLLLLCSDHDAAVVRELEEAEMIQPTAEGANNLGIGLFRLGRRVEADSCFAAALRAPGYADASANRAGAAPGRITVHPLRHLPSRREY
jgi:hypothetical protein